MSDYSSNYADYKEKQSKLAGMLKDASSTISMLNMNQHRDSLDALSGKVNNDSFKIQVVGTFKNGKSTFINSFLGCEILPVYATPCTAVINEVKYGKEKRSMLYFKNPMPEQLPGSIPEKTMAHMRKYKMRSVPPIEIPYEEIEDYAVIPMGKDPKEMLMESPYDRIELFWPLELLENGVEIIDSPGLNEHATRTQVATEYLSKADAVLFVLTANALCGAEEMKFIENDLRRQGFEDVYFIVNRFDTLKDRDKERVIQFAKLKLSDQTSFGEQGIFFVSALQALEGKINQDQALYNCSGMPGFEKTLSEFLVNQKGKVKLSQPARELKRILNEEALFKVIPQQRGMLETNLDDLKKRYETAKPRLEQLNVKKDQLRRRVLVMTDQMMPEVRRYINNYFSDLCANIPVWVNEIEPVTEISMLPHKIKPSAEEFIGEVADKLKDKIEDEQRIWVENTLTPLVGDKVQNLMSTIEASAENVFVEIDKIRVEVSGVDGSYDAPSAGSRVGAAITGFLVSGYGGAALGGMVGFNKAFAKGLAVQFGVTVALMIFGFLNPVTLILLIIGSIIGGAFSGKAQLIKSVKEKVAEKTVTKITEGSYDSVEEMAEGIKTQVLELGNGIVDIMDSEINDVELQVQDIIKQMEQGQADIDKRKKLLASCEEKIKALSTDLDNFIFQLIG